MTNKEVKKELLFLSRELDSAHGLLRKFIANARKAFEGYDIHGDYPITEIMIEQLAEDTDHLLAKLAWVKSLAKEIEES